MTHGRRGGRVTPIRLVAPSSMKWHAAKILTWRRGRRLLNLERRRLRLFISYLTRRGLQARTQKLNTEQLKSFGQYRSLKRRHYALNLRHDVQLRLTEATALWPTVAIEALSALDFRVYHGLPRNRYRTRLFHDAQTLRLVKDLCQNADASGADAMLTNWMAIPEGVRNKSWHLILLFLLHNRPVRALQFLQVLSQPPYVATLMPEVLADALEHLAGRCALNPTGQLSQASAILPVFTLVFERHLAKYQAICSEDLLRSLVRLATYDDLVHLFNLITRANSTVGCYTLLKFANTFSGFGDHDNALRCLHRILESIPPAVAKRVVSRKSFKWSCALVLRKSSMGGHNHSQTTELVAAFLRMGLKLDILMYNVIMHNAMEAGDIPTALRVYRLLEDNKVQPDRYTYSILLHGCAMAEDPALFADFAEHCAEKALELQSPWVASGYLHYLYRRYAKVDLDELAVVAHRAYTRFFLTEPLQDLVGPGVMDYGGPIEDDSARMKPQTVALYIMLQIEIRKALLHGAEEVWKLYSRFRRSVEEACHSPVVDLAKLPVTWNAFLLAFCRRQQFATASEMIKTMTDGQAQGFPQPNIFTWNIFMDGFVKAQQSRAAVRIFEILQSRGVKPDQCTYSTLLKTYVKTQQVGQIADVVGSMDREQQLDGHVLAILTKVRDRKSLMQALEKSKLAKEREETSEQEEQAQKMRRRWNLPGLVHRPPLVQAAEQVETSDIVEVRER